LGVLARSTKAGYGKFRSIDFGQSFDRSTFKFDRSTFQDLRISRYFLMKFVIPLLLTYRNRKIQKLTKTSENNKAKGLTSANQGVQIHNIWHSSMLVCMASGRDDTSSGRIKQWTDGRPDGITRRPDG
jgi:hypothetical protein